MTENVVVKLFMMLKLQSKGYAGKRVPATETEL